MIPKFKVKLRQNLDLRKLQYPPEEVMTLTEDEEENEGCKGLVANHEYRDLRGFSWGDFDYMYGLEIKVLKEAEQRCKTLEELDEFFRQLEDTELILDDFDIEEIPYFELGIASASVAVSALGCCPVSSCRGHYTREPPYPYVSFWAQKKEAGILRRVAKNQPIGIVNYEMEGYGGINIYSANAMDMLNFAKIIRDSVKKRSLNE